MKRTRTIFIIGNLLSLLMLVTGCYKEDISTLYSRQYQLSAEITGINAEILRINNEIVELRNLYTILANKPIVTGFDYRITDSNGQKDTLGIDITLDTYRFFIPYGRDGKDGADGKTPILGISDDGYWTVNGKKTEVQARGEKGEKGEQGIPGQDGKDGVSPSISISSDGYWVINGTKTTVKARGEDGINGKDGANGTTPSISISPDGYWVINGQKTEWKAIGTDGKNGTDGKTPTVEIIGGYWVINGVSTGVPATGPKGDKGDPGIGSPGADGHTPVITISDDGFWVIDGTKSTSKAVPDDGKTPLINAAKDPDNPTDENYYWTIKYPGDENYSFLLVDGQKVKATGPKGDKGDTPVVEPVIESVVQSDDGTSIAINLHDGSSYEIPLLGIKFKLNPGDLALKDGNGLDSLIIFVREGRTIDVPYTSSDNVARIEAMLPAGWSAMADISKDPSRRVIHITSPKLIDLDRAQFEGGATFIAFDQKGAALTQYIKLKLNKYLYMSYFYNELNAVELNRPNSPFNELKWTDSHHLLVEFYELKERKFEFKGKFPAGIGTNEPLTPGLSDYPSFVFNKSDDDVDKQFKVNTFLFCPDSVNLNSILGNDGPEGRVLYAKQYEASDNETYMKPIPYDTYMVQYSYSLNNGSNNELVRIRRAATKYKVHLYKASEFLGVDKANFDYQKVDILLTNQTHLLSSVYKSYNSVSYVAQSNTMKYDSDTDQLECVFCTLGGGNSAIGLNFYYDKEGKKRWEPQSLASVLVRPDWEVNIYVNHTGIPFPGAGTYDNYAGFTNNGEGYTRYGGGRLFEPKNSIEFRPQTLPDLK